MSSVVLKVEHVSKHFGRTTALDDVSLEVGTNEIVGLIGQNGAGKSTLTKIVVGVERPDSGTLTFCNNPISPKNAAEAAKSGISTAYQEPATVPDLQVYQWMYLAHELENTFGVLRTGEMKKQCTSILEEFGIPCWPEDKISELSMVSRKMIEIAKAIQLARAGARTEGVDRTLIILDEPTAPLSDNERMILFKKLKEMKAKSSFLFISHVIPEVLEISDRVYVLRDGKNAGFFDLKTQGTTEQMVYQAMFGVGIEDVRLLTGAQGEGHLPKTRLRVSNLGLKGAFHDVDFDVNEGEILSVDGALHSGKMELVRAIAGLVRQDEGTIETGGKVLGSGVKARIDAGIGYFSGDRSDEIFLIWPVAKNITITVLDTLRRIRLVLPMLDFRKESALAKGMVDELEIQPSRIDTLMKSLSGGNMQKASLAKWLCRNPDTLILVNPTSGIDTKAKMEIYQLLLKIRAEGKSVILVSEDAQEVRRMSDRVVRMELGTVSKILGRSDLN